MTLGKDDVIGVDESSAGVAGLAVTAIADEHTGSARHFRANRLWPRREALGRPRMSTLVLMGVWIAVLGLYLVVRPGG
jgi:hypothetical protein